MEKIIYKKLRQLNATAWRLLDNPTALTGYESEPVRHVLPVVVAGGGLPVSPVTEALIADQIESESLFTHALIDRLCIVDLEELEMLEGLREQGQGPATLLMDWKASSIATMSFRNFLLERFGPRLSDFRPTHQRESMDKAVQYLSQRLGITPDEPMRT